jgi:capsule polysaccharide export protein KpsE/RkpR
MLPPYLAVAALLWQRRAYLAKSAAVGMVLTAILAFLSPNQYKSTVQLMPPDPLATSPQAMYAAMMGNSISSTAAGLGALNSSRTPGGTFMGLLQSRTLQDRLIDRFDLRKVYSCKLYELAREKLTRNSAIGEDKKSGILIITVTDKSPQRAHDLATAYVEELDSLAARVSTSAARRERIFLETRLKSVKDDLDSASQGLSQFSSRNATMDPQTQGKATLEAAEKLQEELIVSESELRGYEANYTDDNMRVRAVRAKVDELRSQLRKLSGNRQDAKAGLGNEQFSPSISSLPLLGVKYNDLYLHAQIEEQLYTLLSKQYESARVQEAREIPTIKVLDAPNVPERKSSPHRILMMLVGAMLFLMGAIAITIAQASWENSRGGSSWQFVANVKQDFLGDIREKMAFFRRHRKDAQ